MKVWPVEKLASLYARYSERMGSFIDKGKQRVLQHTLQTFQLGVSVLFARSCVWAVSGSLQQLRVPPH